MRINRKRILFGHLHHGPLRSHAMLALTRMSTGLFFAISGFYKLFTQNGYERMAATMLEAGIPFPLISAYWVAACELLFGILLLAGLMSRLSALVFTVICLVATATDGIHRIPQGIGAWEWLDWLLYLPEVLYLFLLGFILLLGIDGFSLDRIILRRCRSAIGKT